MKKVSLIILVFLMLTMATPASAKKKVPFIGDRINVYYTGSQNYPADKPFNIRQGFLIDFSETQAIGKYDFTLKMDGITVEHGKRYSQPVYEGKLGVVMRIYNFPKGVSQGTHTFTGVWSVPCQYGPSPETCEQPNKPVVSMTSDVTITFTP